MPFCISILTSVRRIVKIAVRFLHTKTALCDRKDTQSRFAVNAARSIVCVEALHASRRRAHEQVSMPHAALCVSRQLCKGEDYLHWRVSMPHAALCVSRLNDGPHRITFLKGFQCRTQHCVCRDAVSRSPCPARAEKVFWKDALFCAVFGVCG